MVASCCGIAACSSTADQDEPPTISTAIGTDIAMEGFPSITDVVAEMQSSHGLAVVGTVQDSDETYGSVDQDGHPITAGAYIPATLSTMAVSDVFYGEAAAGDTIRVRQRGAPSVAVSDLPRLLPGHTYLVALRPFHWTPSVDTGQYLVIGYYAVWELSSDGSYQWLAHSPPIARYPNTLDTEDARGIFVH